MPNPPDENKLVEKQYATLIVRLMLDPHGRLLSGELVDVANGHSKRFLGWRGMIRAIRTWLNSQSSTRTPDTY